MGLRLEQSGARGERLDPGDLSGEDKARVLIVDDDERNLFALEKVLEDVADGIVCVRSGEEALKHILQDDFAVILLDVLMPGLDGYGTAAMIRRREKSRHVPIIFLTAISKDDVHMFRGYSAGAVDYVFKPVEPLVLRSKVSVFVDLFRKTQEIQRKADHERRLRAENLRVNSERISAERALRRSEERQALIIKSLPIAFYSLELGNVSRGPVFVSDSIAALCGFPAETFREQPGLWAERIHDDDRERVLRQFANLPRSGSSSVEYQWRCADGHHRSFLDHAVVVRDEAGRPREVFGTWVDVTERRRMEQQLVHAQKMDAIGRLTGGIAHDFNNMLTVVIGSLDRLRRTLKGDASSIDRIEVALQGALRCAGLTQRLLAFARRQPLQPQPVDLNELVVRTTELVRRILGESIELNLKCARELLITRADPSQIESALVNLVVNARDAMPAGGTLTIETRNVVVDAAQGPHDPELAPGNYVELSVGDTGAGIPADSLHRVFEPFFTTKDVGQGTGLGLSIIYGFVKQSGGGIKLHSEIGQGTSVRLFLPAIESVAGAAAPGERVEDSIPVARDGEVVLVVEDDEEIRRLATALLHDLGYAVRDARDGHAALRVLEQGDRIDLLFSDIAMPGITGIELASEVAQRWPDVRLLLTSAYADLLNVKLDPSMAARMLRKPYRDHELATAVRSALDASG